MHPLLGIGLLIAVIGIFADAFHVAETKKRPKKGAAEPAPAPAPVITPASAPPD